MASYAGCFRPRLQGQLAHCQQYVKGLFHACRSNVERMNERLPDSSYDALHHFISVSDWDGPAVMDEVARRVQTTLAEVSGEQGLLLEECGWEKAGQKSVGVGRQCIGQVGKVSNGQVGVFAVLSRASSAGLVGGHLYLPAAWCADAARCTQARVPLAARTAASRSWRRPWWTTCWVRAWCGRTGWAVMRPTATRRPYAKPCSNAAKPTYPTWGRGSSCMWPTQPRRRPRPGRAGAVPRAVPRAGSSRWARPWTCRRWRPR